MVVLDIGHHAVGITIAYAFDRQQLVGRLLRCCRFLCTLNRGQERSYGRIRVSDLLFMPSFLFYVKKTGNFWSFKKKYFLEFIKQNLRLKSNI